MFKKYLRLAKIATVLLFFLSFTACKTNQIIAKKVKNEFKNSKVTDKYLYGFALYDLANKEMIFEHNGDRYFTPASNTKLFTFYAGLKIAPDSIPSLRYVERGDSLIFWGTGDPSFLHTSLKGTKAFNFLKNTDKKLFYAPGRYTGDFYGNGWQWDDYNDYYQAEINELPIMDNLVTIASNKKGGVRVSPQLFASCVSVDDSKTQGNFNVKRDFLQNHFITPNVAVPANFSQEIPYKLSLGLTINLLVDTLKKQIDVIDEKMPANAKTIYNLKTDSILKRLMLPSDNFVAEQLLLTYADKLGLELNTRKVIKYIEEKYLSDLPQKISWVDGSGLSRGNLFTPRDIIKLLEKIYQEENNQQKLFNMLPAGGKAGTLRNAYPKTDHPFVFGKTGTLSNNHNQSGYIVTKKGKLFLFSFMNNNFVMPTAEVRNEMVRIVTYIHDNF